MNQTEQTTKNAMQLPAALPDSLSLPPIASWQSPSAHCFDANQRHAIAAAWYANRPLLVRGEPGLGKSQIARAIAASWHWRLITTVVHGRTEVDDLLYSIDYVERLADANASVAVKIAVKALDKYVKHGPVWMALDGNCKEGWPAGGPEDAPALGYKTEKPQSDPGCVLLLDEIDKAQSDVPNALLEVLNNQSFSVPQTGAIIQATNPLFIVITANDERSLPFAFMRRCAVLDLSLGDNEAQRFVEIANAHKAAKLFQRIEAAEIEAVANCVAQYRHKVPQGYYKPGTSEMLDLLHVLDRSNELPDSELQNCLDILAQFLLKKDYRGDEAN